VLLNLKLSYTTLPKDADELQTTIVLIRHAVNMTHKDGLGKLDTQLWAHIESKLDEQPATLDLTLEQWKFIREAVDKTTYPPVWSRLATALYDAMNEVEKSI